MLDGPRPPSHDGDRAGSNPARVAQIELGAETQPSVNPQSTMQQPRYRHLPRGAVACSRRSSTCGQVAPMRRFGQTRASSTGQGRLLRRVAPVLVFYGRDGSCGCRRACVCPTIRGVLTGVLAILALSQGNHDATLP